MKSLNHAIFYDYIREKTKVIFLCISDNTQSPHILQDLADSDKPFELRTQSEKEELYEKIAEQLALIADNYNFNAPGVGSNISASSSFYSSVPSQGSSVDAKLPSPTSPTGAAPTSPTGAADISPEVEGAVGGAPLENKPTELPGMYHCQILC